LFIGINRESFTLGRNNQVGDRTQKSVVGALDKLEKRMGVTAFRIKYKTITMDNVGEFLNQTLLKKSCLKESKNRTKAFYCPPFSSWERGSNENQNAIIRRLIPKGFYISKYSNKFIKEVENYIHSMPFYTQRLQFL
jgi:IS30 family transposase